MTQHEYNARQRERRRLLPEAEKQRRRAKAVIDERARRARFTPEQKEAKRLSGREGQRRHRARMAAIDLDAYRARNAARMKETRAKRPDDFRRYGRLRRAARFGVTPDELARHEIEQAGRCAICKAAFSGGGAKQHLDHDHCTGLFRGLLCAKCNVGLGAFGDDTERLRRAAAYLERSRLRRVG